MSDERLEYRMYFFVPYNISDIQKGIQAGHAALRYALKFGRGDENAVVWDFIHNDETFIILNGGTTNDKFNNVLEKPVGTINQTAKKLMDNKISYTVFREPDLNNAVSAICFLADERVWDFEKYPDWLGGHTSMPYADVDQKDGEVTLGEPIETDESGLTYNQWVERIGGGKNLFLRNLVHPKNAKLA